MQDQAQQKLSRVGKQDFEEIAKALLRSLSTANTEVQQVRNQLSFPTPLQQVLGINPQDSIKALHTLTERSNK